MITIQWNGRFSLLNDDKVHQILREKVSDMSIAKMTVELEELKDERDKIEKEFNSKNSMARNGAIALLIGIALAIFVSGWIGGFLILIGLLATLTNVGKKNKMTKELKNTNNDIKLLRRKMINAAE